MSRLWTPQSSLSLTRRCQKLVSSFRLIDQPLATFQSTKSTPVRHLGDRSTCLKFFSGFLSTAQLRRFSTKSTEPEATDASKDATSELKHALVEMDECQESGTRQMLQRHDQSIFENQQEPLSVKKTEESSANEWLRSNNLAAKTVETPVQSAGSNPWFVDQPESNSIQPTQLSSPPTTPPPPPPPDLPVEFASLYDYLIDSPFLDRSSISFINAKAEFHGHGDAAWTDWVVVTQLKQGREGGIRGAIEAIRETLAANTNAPVRIEGISGNPDASWAMVDAGKVVVHVLTEESRQVYRIEDIWTGRPAASPINSLG